MPSQITNQLIQQLLDRDARGLRKYGTSLDRKDLTIEQWLQHQVEELLDGAGYAAAAMREVQVRLQEYALLRRAVEQTITEARNTKAPSYAGEEDAITHGDAHAAGQDEIIDLFIRMLRRFDTDAVLRQAARDNR